MNHTIEQIITFLRDTYEHISPSQLKEHERAINNMVCNPAHSIATVFNMIQVFQDLCALIQNQNTNTQLVTYAYLFFEKIGIFMTS